LRFRAWGVKATLREPGVFRALGFSFRVFKWQYCHKWRSRSSRKQQHQQQQNVAKGSNTSRGIVRAKQKQCKKIIKRIV
jgi:hypothetical protein